MKPCKLYFYIDNEEYVKKALQAIFEENGDALDNLQIEVLDGVANDITKACVEEYLEKFPKHISYVSCKGVSEIKAYGDALDITDVSYVGFMKATGILSKDSLLELRTILETKGQKACSLTPVYYNRKGTLVPYLKFEEPRDVSVDLNENPQWQNAYLGSYLFDASLLQGFQFHRKLNYEALPDMLMRLLNQTGAYFLCGKTILVQEDLEVDTYNYAPLYEKAWYVTHMKEYVLPVLSKNPSRYVQCMMLYWIAVRYAGNLNDRNKAILQKEDREELYDLTRQAMKFIDDDIILHNGDLEMKRIVPRHIYYKFYSLKYDLKPKDVAFKETEKGLAAVIDDVIVEYVSNTDVRVNAINDGKETLDIWAKLRNVYFVDFDKVKVYTLIDDEKVYADRNEIYTLTKVFGESVNKEYSFCLSIKKALFKGTKKFRIYMEYGNDSIPLVSTFAKPQSRLWHEFAAAYWRFDKYYLSYNAKTATYKVERRNWLKGLCKEICYCGSFLKNGMELKRSIKCIPLRMLYFITKPYYGRKSIWITYDQLFKGGDNGEYFYRYVSERKDKGNIQIYYIANKNSKEYKELNEKYGTVLAFNSLKHKLLSLHADYVFATRVAFNVYLGYWQQTERYFRDMFNAEIFCLQHGLTIQKIAQYQNRLFDNTKLYFCVSPVEMDNLRHPIYGYKEEELLLTGAPRYDGLVSNDKRYILISPTWRRNVTSGTNKKGSNHEYSPNFKNTEYFHIYNSLINDEKLIAYAKKYNYKLIYLIHPILSPQIKDFTTNDYVEIIPGAGNVSYEKMLSEASMMLTDHSGIQFDFAYMRKPLVYYHPDSLPPQYEEGGLKYETMGFGPVCKNHESVVDALCAYMEKECVMQEEYVKRVDSFFGFDDRKNCERIYEATLKYIREK